MTTPITKEWLQQTIEDIEDVLKTNISGKNDSDVVNMLTALKMALAAMDAEPVGEFYHEKQGGWYEISEGDKVPDNRRIPLYTTSPLPVVPDEMTPELLPPHIRELPVIAAMMWIQGWNAYRAALSLQEGDKFCT